MYDKSRITAIMLCLIMLFQAQTYAATRKPVEETATYKVTNQNIVNFDGISGGTMLENDNTILYSPANMDKGNYVKITLPKGKFKLECYGSKSKSGVKGGYSSGIYETKKVLDLYLYCGGSNGYNGGGQNAGGATHIATKEGLLKERSKDYKTNLIMVAGGAGAGGNGVGGGLSGGNGGGDARGGGVQNTTISGSKTEAGGGTQKEGGKGGTSTAGGSTSSGKAGSFGQGGAGTYGGGGGFYGGGSGGGTVTSSKWVKVDGVYTTIGAESTTYGAGGSGYINSSLITDTATEQGKNADAGKIKITCLEVRHDYYTNTLHAPNQIMSGSIFTVHSESEFNSNYRNVTEVKYQIKSGDEVLLNKKAELISSISEGAVVKEGYSKQLKMPECQANEVCLEMVITYDDGEIITLSQVISLIGQGKEKYSDGIRYVGQGFKLNGKSKWMSNKKLHDELNNSINKTEPEEIRNLK